MKIKAKDLKVGNTVVILGNSWKVKEFEESDIGKQGSKKIRLVLKNAKDEEQILIRPQDYPFEVK